MKNKTVDTFRKVTAVAIALTALLTVGVALAYLSFREKSETNILNSFPHDNTVISAARLLFAIDLIATYPLGLYVCRDTIEKSVFAEKAYSRVRHFVLTVLVIASTAVVASVTCDLGVLLQIVGGIASSMV